MDNYLGEIRIFAGDFAPRNWAFCNGALLNIANNQALFALLGTVYGGDGRTTFGLPDLRGRVVINQGVSAYQANYPLGNVGGVETVTLTESQMPIHNHQFMVSTSDGTKVTVENNYYAAPVAPPTPTSANKNIVFYQPDTDGEVKSPFMKSTIQPVGGSQPHENRQPYLTVSYIIALTGIYPSPS